MTKIEWTDRTWNPVTGCSKVSEGCRNCYAEKMSLRFNWTNKPWNSTNALENVQFHPNRLEIPLRWKHPSKIFVNSMSDLFHEEVPFEFIDSVFAVMALTPHHIFQILTKRPERMFKYFDTWFTRHKVGALAREWSGRSHPDGHGCDPDVCNMRFPLPNVWLGVSVESQKAADERIPLLLQTPAAVRFLSCEPLLDQVNIRGYLMKGVYPGLCGNCGKGHGFTRCPNYGGISKTDIEYGCDDFKRVNFAIDWVIVGGESGSAARPMHPDWVISVRDQCNAAGVPFFFKQWGEWIELNQYKGDIPKIQGKKLHNFDHNTRVIRLGKRDAGRLIEGRSWDEMPVLRRK